MYEGDPHNVVQCPNCQWRPSHEQSYFRVGYEVLTLQHGLLEAERIIANIKNRLKTLTGENKVREMNLIDLAEDL